VCVRLARARSILDNANTDFVRTEVLSPVSESVVEMYDVKARIAHRNASTLAR
jgi:hypothetical protein